ncbi:WD40/YVTN/BNR-like repeat-containing protein [Ferrimicrobium acidiphilum]|uniref:WD40/YVTN/BNR-like repeat-containing protein n=1 Tax=Ferrimicrobium acidiphilum TaxID=121039 RepID=UPI003C6D6D9D
MGRGYDTCGSLSSYAGYADAQTGNVTALFVSDDGGRTFAQLDLPTNYGTYQAAMLSSIAGVITGGNSYQGVWFTPNGGKNWEPASIPGFAPSPYNTVGTPVAFGTQIYVPIALGVGANAKTTLYESTDGGASFKALTTQNHVGSLIVAANGPDIWLFNAPHEIVESSNDGLSWTTVSSPTLAKEVASVELVSPSKAVVTTINYGCTGFKTGCYYNTYQQATTNSGKTWTENALSPTPNG